MKVLGYFLCIIFLDQRLSHLYLSCETLWSNFFDSRYLKLFQYEFKKLTYIKKIFILIIQKFEILN